MYNHCYCPNPYSHMPYWPAATIQDTIIVESDEVPFCGQINRSSENFNGAGNFSIDVPEGVSFRIMIDKKLAFDDPVLGDLRYTKGSTVLLDPKENYYIANPEGAFEPFKVTLTTIVPPRPGGGR